MIEYLKLVKDIIENGNDHDYRNGVRRSLFNRQLNFDLSEKFPAVTTRKITFENPFAEILWFLSGSTNTKDLLELGATVNFWNKWEDENGDIGSLYGGSWRSAPNNTGKSTYDYKYDTDVLMGTPEDIISVFDNMSSSRAELISMCRYYHSSKVDQIGNLLYNLQKNPYSTRHRVSTFIPEWQGDERLSPIDNINRGKGGITPCASLLHFTVCCKDGKDHLSLHVSHLSSDVMIGLPYNIAQYALLTILVANEVNMNVGNLYYTLNDVHIYKDQIDTVMESGFLDRVPYELPTIKVNKDKSIFNVRLDDIEVVGYKSHPFFKLPIS